jgi:GH43 family beta-xylosidase
MLGTAGRAALVAALLALAACSSPAAPSFRASAAGRTISNPVLRQRADPSVFKAKDGYYYLTASVPSYEAVELRRSKTLQGLGTAVPVTVFRTPPTGPESGWIWAPDIRQYDGVWFLYYSGSPGSDRFAQRLYTMQTSAANPLTGTWKQDGRLATGYDSFTIDATSFTAQSGRRYLVWAQKDAATRANSNIYIARLQTPTRLSGPAVELSRPDLPWEQVGYSVNEAPAVMQSHGKVFLTYSASATDANYTMGLLSAAAAADPLMVSSWTKSTNPVFGSSVATSVFGPGSNSFTVSDDGRDIINVFNARSYAQVADPLTDPNRNVRMQKVTWRADGTPDFGVPAPDGPTPQ